MTATGIELTDFTRGRFVVVQDAKIKERLVDYANCPSFVGESPVVIVGCGKPVKPIASSDQSSYVIDTAIALCYLTLAAEEYGVGSCWISIFEENKVKEILEIPDEIKVIALISLGYPKTPVSLEPIKKRLPLAQLIKFEKW